MASNSTIDDWPDSSNGTKEMDNIKMRMNIPEIAMKINSIYKKVRKTTINNKWKLYETLAETYYNFAVYYDKQIFEEQGFDLDTVKVYLEKSCDNFQLIPIDCLTPRAININTKCKLYLQKVRDKYESANNLRSTYNRKNMLILKNEYIEKCILFGKFDDIPWKHCSPAYREILKQQIKMIKLLRLINNLEETITLTKLTGKDDSVKNYIDLSHAYKSVNLPSLSIEMAMKFIDKIDKTNENFNFTKEDIKSIITKEIENSKTNLDQTKVIIAQTLDETLNIIDIAYIERKYMSICSDFLIKEIEETLDGLVTNGEKNIITSIFNTLDSIQNLQAIPEPFNQLAYFKLFSKHSHYLKKNLESKLLCEFKKQCIQQTLVVFNNIKAELNFLTDFINFLTTFKNLKSIVKELHLNNFCDGQSTFANLIDRVLVLDNNLYGANLKKLQDAGVQLQANELFLTGKYREIIGAFIESCKLTLCKEGDREIIEVIGKSITISEVLPELIELLSKSPKIEEIRFIGSSVIHIDKSLEDSLWMSKNIVVSTVTIKIYDEIVWNVSGEDGSDLYENNAGLNEETGLGRDGKDGYPGCSGGNVFIKANFIQNPANLTIISNGGRGGKGQDGGNGRDGSDGSGIKRADFENNYPPCVQFAATHSIRGRPAIAIAEKIEKNANINKKWNKSWHIFREVITENGNEIIFSHCESVSLFTRAQAFILYKGSLGKPGCQGGKLGVGGQGGYPGHIQIICPEDQNFKFNQINKIAIGGEDGEIGKGGEHGYKGKNGWDMGFTDYQLWSKAAFYGLNENSTLSVEYYNSGNSDRIWCPYNGKYADITSRSLENPKLKKFKERNSAKKSDKREHHAMAIRCNDISQNKIDTKYSKHLVATEKNSLETLRFELETINKRAMDSLNENQQQEVTQISEIGVRRQTKFSNKIKTQKNKMEVCDSVFRDLHISNTKEIILKKLEKYPWQFENWLELKRIVLKEDEVMKILTINENMSKLQTFTKFNSKQIEKLIVDKYRCAILQRISSQLSEQKNRISEIQITPQNVVKYLTVIEKSNDDIYNNTLGNFNKYLFEYNEENLKIISKFCEETTQKENFHIFKDSIISFVLEMGTSATMHKNVTKCYKDYYDFHEKQMNSLNIYFEVFKRELSMPGYEKLNKLWFESIKNKHLNMSFKIEVEKHKHIKLAYEKMNQQMDEQFNWEICLKDKDVRKAYSNYIQQNGPKCESYKILLAYVFGIKLCFYVESENELILNDVYNSNASTVLYIYEKANDFHQLHFNEDFFELDNARMEKDILCFDVLKKINSLKTEKQLQNFVKNFRTTTTQLNRSNNILSNDNIDEEFYISQITQYFSNKIEQQNLSQRLRKILYIGNMNILKNLYERFSIEGRHISIDILYYLINRLLLSFIEQGSDQNQILWIIASFPQENWIDELILLQLEDYFQKQLEETRTWRKYLNEISNKEILLLFGVKLMQNETLSVKSIDETLYLLSCIKSDINLLNILQLSEWNYALKENYWKFKLSKLTQWKGEDIDKACFYVLSMENNFGGDLTEKLITLLKNKSSDLSVQRLLYIFTNYHNEKWNLNDSDLEHLKNSDIIQWETKMERKFTICDKDRNVSQLVEFIKSNANTSELICIKLNEIQSAIESTNSDITDINGKSIKGLQESDIKKWAKDFKKNCNIKENLLKTIELLAVINRAIELKRNFRLRDTQKLTILLLFTNMKTLVQVCTGEGKSLIVVAGAIIKALRDEKIDIVTSSAVLAKRDAEDNTDLYNLFNINVSHNCNQDIEKRKLAYSENQVVYGDLSNFQRDYLLDRFYQKNILGSRSFENIIVDEVDSILLDKGNNMLYLSHDIAGLDKLESVYIYIWQWISRPALDTEELLYTFNIKSISNAIMRDLYGMITKSDIKQMGSDLKKTDINNIWEHLINCNIIDNAGKLLVSNIINFELLPKYGHYSNQFTYLFNECVKRYQYIRVPNFLKPFIELHLESWIKSAITAFFMDHGQDYIIDVDRSGASPDKNPQVTIIDRDTGTDMSNSQWDEALHQFLQLKHGCKLSMQSLKAVFISNVSYFKLYRNLYGLTGTLGSIRERDLLREIYNIEFATIPTARTKQFIEVEAILCTDERDWMNQIYNQSLFQIKTKERSVLIICDTVNDALNISKIFSEKQMNNIHIYTRDYEDFDILQRDNRLEPGHIVLATNLAGRGTDIKISNKLRSSGGLHVILSYLPSNVRIQQQAFGRAARCGDMGSGQLIIRCGKGNKYSIAKIIDLKNKRNEQERYRLSEIKDYYESQIVTEEKCFEKFQKQYKCLKQLLMTIDTTSLKNYKDLDNLKEILLQSCLDKWAFWLDKHSQFIIDVKEKHVQNSLMESLELFIKHLKNLKIQYGTVLLDWVKDSPIHLIKLGVYLCKNKNYDTAITMFNEVIYGETFFAEAAHYFKAFAYAKKFNWEKKPLKDEHEKFYKFFKMNLYKSAKLFQEHNKFELNAKFIIGELKKTNKNGILQITAYEEQKQTLSQIYEIFLNSIDNIVGHPVTPDSFQYTELEDSEAESIYDKLLDNNYLKNSKIKYNISEKMLETLALNYGVAFASLKSFFKNNRGKEFNEKEMLESLKLNVNLASRGTFWKTLIKQNILYSEISFVIIDEKKLTTLASDIKGKLDNMKREVFQNIDQLEIFLNVELIPQQKDCKYIYKKENFLITMGRSTYHSLKKQRILSFNKKAYIAVGKLDTAKFCSYDSITLSDFNKINIAKEDAEKIIESLVQDAIIEKDIAMPNDLYRLKQGSDKIAQIELSFCPLYINNVRGLLFASFAYRIALQKIKKDILEHNFPIHIKLHMKPHRHFLFELVDQRIFKPVRINNKKVGKEDLQNIFKDVSFIKEDTIDNMIDTMHSLNSSIKSLNVPDMAITSLIEFYSKEKFAFTEELHIFNLNGLDHIIKFEEKKWTLSMLLKTAFILFIGIGQIIAGALIDLYSVGAMTHVGTALLSEGISDIMFSISAYNSGYFSWKDYGKHKLQSLIFTAGTSLLSAWISSGFRTSRYGVKLFGYKSAFGRLFGKGLINKVGWNVVGKEIAKRIIYKVGEGITIGMANIAVDRFVQNKLKSLCEGISSSILPSIANKIRQHNLLSTLERAYLMFGKEKATQLVNNTCKSYFKKKSVYETFIFYICKINSCLLQGLSNALEKISKAGINMCSLVLRVISDIVKYTERFAYIANIRIFFDGLLNNLDRKLRAVLNDKEKKKKTSNPESTQVQNMEECDKFKSNVIDQLEIQIQNKSRQIIADHLVGSFMKDGVHFIMKIFTKQMKKIYYSSKEKKYREYFEKNKNDYKEQLKEALNLDDNERIQKINEITKIYQNTLMKIFSKTKNPDLVADLVRENIPMDMTCVKACIPVIQKSLREMNINLDIKVKIGDIQETFSSEKDDNCKNVCISLDLSKSHFLISGKDRDSLSTNNTNENNCLYEALVTAILDLKNCTPRMFRNNIAKNIQEYPEIRNHIKQGWHRALIGVEAYGGARKHIPINKNVNTLNVEAEKQQSYQHNNSRGSWKYQPDKDIDLRDTKPLTNEEYHEQLANAFNEALIKINDFLENIDKKCSRIVPYNFKATKYDKILVMVGYGATNVALYPVEMETEIKVNIKDLGEVTYKVRIDFDNPEKSTDLQGPHGPHIGYEVIRTNKTAPEGTTGHILINKNPNSTYPDRHRSLQNYNSDSPIVPIPRLFFPPVNPRIVLQRTNAQNKYDIDKNETRGRKFPRSYM